MNPHDFLAQIADFTFTSKYARYNEKAGRRETWHEAVGRLERMHLKRFHKLADEDKARIRWAFDRVRDKLVAPSMRSLQFGGKAIEAHEARIFNCSVRHIDSIRSFAECFYLLLCGCGVGIGLSRRFLDRLPDLVPDADTHGIVVHYAVDDTIEGWADSIEALLNCYFRNTAYSGRRIAFDYSRIRKKGTPLKTGGGKAPGHRGLKHAHEQIRGLLDELVEQKVARLRTIHAYDILMFAADAVLSGGVRRSATCVVFQPDDEDMMNAKVNLPVTAVRRFSHEDGLHYGRVTVGGKTHEVELDDWSYAQLLEKKEIGWIHIHPQRARSNNSVLLLRDEVTPEQLQSVIGRTRQFGEPGFVFGGRSDQLFNPCFEIGFVPVTEDGVCGVQFCNLTTQNGALIDSNDKFAEATEAATIIGTLQAAYTHFPYLSPAAKHLTEKEALLGVSITGIMDNPLILLNGHTQRVMAELAVKVNAEWAGKLGINPAARITCVKPEGTSSLVLGTASGIHPHHARRYFRRMQFNRMDPVYRFLKKHNPHACEESVWSAHKTDEVVTFPITVPGKAMVKSELTAIGHLDIIRSTQMGWVEPGRVRGGLHHNVSCTVMVREEEWDEVVRYLFTHRHRFAAVSLLPAAGDKLYKQAPMEAISTAADEAKWRDLVDKWVPVDFTQLKEDEDDTQCQNELSCAGGACDVR